MLQLCSFTTEITSSLVVSGILHSSVHVKIIAIKRMDNSQNSGFWLVHLWQAQVKDQDVGVSTVLRTQFDILRPYITCKSIISDLNDQIL